MKRFKRITAALTAIFMLLSFAACGDENGGEPDTDVLTEQASSYIRDTKTKIAALSGVPALCVSKFSSDRAYNYETTVYETEVEITELIKNGGTDMAVVPVDYAARLYNETSGAVKVLAVNSLGFFHIIEKGEKIQSVADLKGKTVYAAYKGTGYEAVINRIFTENGIDPEKDIELKFSATEAEAARFTDDGTAEVILLCEPAASKVVNNNSSYRKALDLNAEWNKICETPLAQTVVVAREEYISANPDIIKEFIGFDKISVNYLRSNVYGAPVFLQEMGLAESSQVATLIIPGINLSFLDGEEMKAAVGGVLEVLGITVDDGIYYL